MPHGVEEDKAGPSLQFYLSILFYQLYLATLFAHTFRAHTLFVLLLPHYATPYHMLHHFMLSSTTFLCIAPKSKTLPAQRLHNGDESGTLRIILSGRVAIFFLFSFFFYFQPQLVWISLGRRRLSDLMWPRSIVVKISVAPSPGIAIFSGHLLITKPANLAHNCNCQWLSH